MPRNFQPSPHSESSEAQVLSLLAYLRQAVDITEKHVKAGGSLPPWVAALLYTAAQSAGSMVAYVQHAEEKNGKKGKRT